MYVCVDHNQKAILSINRDLSFAVILICIHLFQLVKCHTPKNAERFGCSSCTQYVAHFNRGFFANSTAHAQTLTYLCAYHKIDRLNTDPICATTEAVFIFDN